MPLRIPGQAAPLPLPEREALFTRLAVYLERSGPALAEAFALDEERVRALPRFVHPDLSYEVPLAVAGAAAHCADPGLLAWAEELRERVRYWFREPGGDQRAQRALMDCAIEHAKRRCGRDHAEGDAFARLFAWVEEHGLFGRTDQVCLRAGRVEVLPRLQSSVFPDEVQYDFLREAGMDAYLRLVEEHRVRLSLDRPIPDAFVPAIYPALRDRGLFAHSLLIPEARAAEFPREAVDAFVAQGPQDPNPFASTPRIAAVLALEAELDHGARALGALRGHVTWVLENALHLPRARAVIVQLGERLLEADASPEERALVAALPAFEQGDRDADRTIAGAAKAIVARPADRRLLPLLALFRLAMARGLPLTAFRVAGKLPKDQRPACFMEVAQVYAEAGDLGGVAEILKKVEPLNHRRPHELNPLALAFLRSLAVQEGAA